MYIMKDSLQVDSVVSDRLALQPAGSFKLRELLHLKLIKTSQSGLIHFEWFIFLKQMVSLQVDWFPSGEMDIFTFDWLSLQRNLRRTG